MGAIVAIVAAGARLIGPLLTFARAHPLLTTVVTTAATELTRGSDQARRLPVSQVQRRQIVQSQFDAFFRW